MSSNRHALLALSVIALAGCSDGPSGTGTQIEADRSKAQIDGEPEQAGKEPPVRLATYQSNGLSLAGRTQGILRNKDGCLMIDHGGNGLPDILVFPSGAARWIDSEQSLVYKGIATKLGGKIDLAGGAIDVKGSDVVISGLAGSCNAKSVWLVG